MLFLKNIKSRLTSFFILILLYGLYNSFSSYITLLNLQLNELFLKPLLGYEVLITKIPVCSYFKNKAEIKIYLVKDLIDDSLFIVCLLILIFVLVFSYRIRKWSFQNADFMHFPIIFSFLYLTYLFIKSYHYMQQMLDTYDQHILFTILYYILLFVGLFNFLTMILIAKDYNLGDFKKQGCICLIFLFYYYLFNKLFFFSLVYAYNLNLYDNSFFSSLEEQKEILDSVLALYGLTIFCSNESFQAESKTLQDPCISEKKTKDFYCGLSKEIGKLPTLRGGDFETRTIINGATAAAKGGSKYMCNDAIKLLLACLKEHDK